MFAAVELGSAPLRRPQAAGGSVNGGIAQLGERLNGIQEVGGSIPPGSTIQSLTNSRFSPHSRIAPTFPQLMRFVRRICGLTSDFDGAISPAFWALSQALENIFPIACSNCAETGSSVAGDGFVSCMM